MFIWKERKGTRWIVFYATECRSAKLSNSWIKSCSHCLRVCSSFFPLLAERASLHKAFDSFCSQPCVSLSLGSGFSLWIIWKQQNAEKRMLYDVWTLIRECPTVFILASWSTFCEPWATMKIIMLQLIGLETQHMEHKNLPVKPLKL